MGRFARWSVAICDFEAKSFTVKYKCSKCGEEHEGWPALTFKAPQQYQDLSEEEKSHIATLSDDFCVIRYSDQVDRFIRV
jgi:hypothetical protein